MQPLGEIDYTIGSRDMKILLYTPQDHNAAHGDGPETIWLKEKHWAWSTDLVLLCAIMIENVLSWSTKNTGELGTKMW